MLLSVAVVGVLCRWAKFVEFGCLRDLGAPLREPMHTDPFQCQFCILTRYQSGSFSLINVESGFSLSV